MARPTRRRLLIAVAALAVAPGCATWKAAHDRTVRFVNTDYDDPQAEQRLAAAEERFANGEYSAAQKEFKAIADNKKNAQSVAERARWFQAECRRMNKEYPEAVDTYNRLLNDFPTGAHRQEACGRMFEIADYWLDDFRAEVDKRKTEKGVLAKGYGLPNFTDKTRPTVAVEDRAMEALEHVHTHDVTGPTADQALFRCGYVNYVRGNFTEADHYLSQLAENYKESPLRPQAVILAVQAKNNATGGPEYDDRKAAEALKLVRQARATMPELTQKPEMAETLTKAEFAVRTQQAEKMLKQAEYYERTRHPGSAYFTYELLRRQHGGTRYSDLATARMEKLKGQLERRRNRDEKGMWESIEGRWNELIGKEQPVTDPPPVDPGEVPVQASPLPPTAAAPPASLPGTLGVRP